MAWYRTLGPVTYTDGDQVRHITKAGVRIDLTPTQAAELAGMIVLDRTTPFTYPRADFLKYDSQVLFPIEGIEDAVYLANDSGLLYRWINDDYAPVGVSTTWGGVSGKPEVIAAGSTQADAQAALGGTATGRAVFTAEDAAEARGVLGAADARGVGLVPAVVGDGTDETAALQATIDATPVNPLLGVAVVKVPEGYHKVTASLIPKSNLILQGMGEGTVIDFSTPTASGDRLFDFASGATLDHLTIQDMRIIGEGYNLATNTNSVAVHLNADSMTRVKLQRLQIENFQTGILLSSDGAIQQPIVKDCVVTGCSYVGIRVGNSRGAQVTGNSVNCTRAGLGDTLAGLVGIWCPNRSDPALCSREIGVHNNYVVGARYEGINMMAQLVSVTGNRVRACGETGIVFEPIAYNAPNDSDAEGLSVISGNVVTDSVGQNIVVRHDPVNNDRASGRIAITGNVTSGGNVGIRVGQDTTTDFGPEEVTVTGNVCLKHLTYGIRVIMARRVTLVGNVCAAVAAGLQIESTSKIVTVLGGSYRGTGANGDGIRIVDSASFVTLTAVSVDNVDRYGIFINGTAHDITITDPIVVDDQGVPTMNHAVRNESSGANITVGGKPLVSGMTGDDYYGVQPTKVESGAFAARMLAPATYLSTYYYFCQPGGITTGALGNGNLRVGMWLVTEEVSVSAFFAEFTVAGEAGSTFRIGVFAADGSGGMPSTLLCDAGTVATDGTPGVVAATLGSPVTFPPGVYWVGGAIQNAATTPPTMRTVSNPVGPGGPLQATLPGAGTISAGYLKASVSGALGTFSAPGASSSIPRIGFRVA